MIAAFDELWDQTRPAFSQRRTFLRARRLALSALACLGRRTVTGLLTTSGRQFRDWSADYRVFEQERFRSQGLFDVARRAVGRQLPAQEPFVALLDDTLLRKRGRKVAGASWRRDPLGPPFCNNFIWGQRFLQVSAALPEQSGASRARAIPVGLAHCPTPRKPRKHAPALDWEDYTRQAQHSRIGQQAARTLENLRQHLDEDPGGRQRRLVVSVDGGFTNQTLLKNLPPRVTLIGRIRKDAKLYALPQARPQGAGRKPAYGLRLPTPEELRQDDATPWIDVHAYAAGKTHTFQVKTLGPVRWRAAGGAHDLRLAVIRPLAYRPSKGAHMLYRDPVYLICTDPTLPLEKLVQYYVWRWEIELNFRDEKSLLGVGQAQVWTSKAVESVPSLLVSAYSLLMLAVQRVYGSVNIPFPRPKWRAKNQGQRISTSEALGLLRVQLWGKALGVGNFSGFASNIHPDPMPEKFENSLPTALLYANG